MANHIATSSIITRVLWIPGRNIKTKNATKLARDVISIAPSMLPVDKLAIATRKYAGNSILAGTASLTRKKVINTNPQIVTTRTNNQLRNSLITMHLLLLLLHLFYYISNL
jgi:hypothetical protein